MHGACSHVARGLQSLADSTGVRSLLISRQRAGMAQGQVVDDGLAMRMNFTDARRADDCWTSQ